MICEACDIEMERETVLFVVRVRGRRQAIEQPGWYCWTCGAGRHTAGDLMAAETALVALPRRAQEA